MKILYFILVLSTGAQLCGCEKKQPQPDIDDSTTVTVEAVETTEESVPQDHLQSFNSQNVEYIPDTIFQDQIITTAELKTFFESAFNMDSVDDYMNNWECFGFENSETLIYVGKKLDMFSCTNDALEGMLDHNIDPTISLRKEAITQAMQNYEAAIENPLAESHFDAFFPVKIFWEKEQGHDFQYVNKNAITWLAANIIPPADMVINGVKAQDLYDRVLKNLCRSMMFYYLYLHHTLDIEKELRWYNRMMDDEDDLLAGDWLEFRYNQSQYTTPGIQSSYKQQPSYFIGFWLRRNIDASDEELLNALKKILRNYDPLWLEKIHQQFL